MTNTLDAARHRAHDKVLLMAEIECNAARIRDRLLGNRKGVKALVERQVAIRKELFKWSAVK